jgi:hypothetical protein
MFLSKHKKRAFVVLLVLPVLIAGCGDNVTIHKVWQFKKREIQNTVAGKKDGPVLPDSVDLGQLDLRNSTQLVNTVTKPVLKKYTLSYEIADSILVVSPNERLRHSFKIANLSPTELKLIPQNEPGGDVVLLYEAVEE